MDKLNSTYVPHIKNQTRTANLILFTGAGFSAGARNILGSNLPLGNELKQKYWKLCYADDEFEEDSKLADLYDACLIKNRKELISTTRNLFSIKNKSLENWYRYYFKIPWLSAYTINIDNIEKIANGQFNITRQWTGISAASKYKSDLNLPNPQLIQLVHLNGCLEDLPDKVTFSTTQYSASRHTQNPWALKLSNDLLSHSIIFVGTNLDEPQLWYYLTLRGERGKRGLGELRPRSYLVTPKLSKSRITLLSSFNIAHISMTAESFATEVLSKFTHEDLCAGHEKIRQRSLSGKSSSQPQSIKNLDLTANLKTEFLLGEEPVWSDITSGRAIETELDKQFFLSINSELSKRNPRAILVSGPAGSGKTTSLMRVVIKLHAKGKNVYWIDRDIEISPYKIPSFLVSETEIDVLAIDDSDRYGQELSHLLTEISNKYPSILILFEMRSHFIDHCLVDTDFKGKNVLELVVPKLGNKDITYLIDALDKDNKLGKLKGQPRAKQISAFRDSAERELIVAMYEATTGLRFRDKIIDELSQLVEPARSIYILTAVANSRRFNLTKKEILLGVGECNNENMNEVDILCKRRLITHPRGNQKAYVCHHRTIGEFIQSAAHQQGLIYPAILGILRMSALSEKSNRMLKVFINHDLVYKLLDLNQAQQLYSELEDILNESHHFWLHRGSLEVEYGRLEYAENCLNQARNLAPKDPLVKNEWAYLLFKKAISMFRTLESPDLANEAENILVELIYENPKHPHPYHLLGSQGLLWSRCGIQSIEERRNYLQRIEKYVLKGTKEPHQIKKLKKFRKKSWKSI